MFLLLAAGCKSPFGRTKDSSSGPTGSLGGSGQFAVFNDELVSGGGAFEYPGGNNLSLAFDDHSDPLSRRSIRFAWNGQPTDATTITFAGMSLMHVPVFANYDITPPRDLRAAGYTRVVFAARGALSTFTSVKIEAGGPASACMTLSASGTTNECFLNNNPATPCLTCQTLPFSSGWRSYSLPLSSAQQSAIKDFFKATFIFDNPTPGSTNPGQGGTIYLDQIFYKP